MRFERLRPLAKLPKSRGILRLERDWLESNSLLSQVTQTQVNICYFHNLHQRFPNTVHRFLKDKDNCAYLQESSSEDPIVCSILSILNVA